MCPGGIRACTAICLSARTIRSPDYGISTCTGSACAHAVECDGVPMHGASFVAIARRRGDERRTCFVGESLLHGEGARDGGLGARTAGRKRYPARSRRRPFCRRRGGYLFL